MRALHSWWTRSIVYEKQDHRNHLLQSAGGWRAVRRFAAGYGERDRMMRRLVFADTKPCSKCRRILPVGEFTRRANRPSGLRSNCKDCRRAWDHTPAARTLKNAGGARWRRRYPEKVRGQTQVYEAIRRGALVKAGCSVCGTNVNVQGHHHNGYEDPLDVVWLCRPHHQEEHTRLRGTP